MAVVRSRGKKPIHFKEGGMHQTLGIPMGKPIPAGEMQAAMAGKRGPKAKKQAMFKRNVLTGRKKK